MTRRAVVGVGAVVLVGDKILLVKRGNEPCRGCWSIPGGHLEYGESIGEAAHRELLEETGINARPLGIIYVDEILPSNSSRYHFVLIDVLMDTKYMVEPKASSDALQARFYPLDNLPKPLTPSTKRFINYLKLLIKKNKLYDSLIPLSEV
ncbi:NUDIX hydrolase [Staphylothermus hellenicus]|uniref:NUDIX hydrolase n=1 Tax=Staphylothermus hellenicus (strain DSM 12710 / JCM 10830 / BK20S6-10-b1 / P8) TaxID=591019 RepID=D7D9C3_STAHD|nr:NUDIX hydrolase [Staphylothermus hellenicus]ADI32369.1 NUDIX hydrolase [Staphylothermus hellenicus DSM 12710]